MGRIGSTSFIDLSHYGDRMAQGMSLAQRGYALGQQDRELDMRQQALSAAQADDAVRIQLLQQELSERRRNAEMLLAQQEADKNFMAWLTRPDAMQGYAVQGPAGPRPQQMQQGPAPFQVPGGVPGAEALNGWNAQNGPAPAGPMQAPQAVQQPGMPAAQPAPPWYQGLDPRTLANASPNLQGLVVQAANNRQALLQRRAEMAQQYSEMKAKGLHRYAPAKTWQEWAMNGVPVDVDEAPEEFRQQSVNEDEAVKGAYIDIMTIQASPDGMGPVAVDHDTRARLMGMPRQAVEVFFRDWQNRMQVQDELAKIAARNQFRTDPLADDMLRIEWQNVTAAAGAADKDYRDALAAYQRVNVDDKGRTLGAADVSQEDLERSRQEQDPPGLGNKLGDKAYERLRGRADAWQRLQAAKAERDKAVAAREQMARAISQRNAAPQQPSPAAQPAPAPAPATTTNPAQPAAEDLGQDFREPAGVAQTAPQPAAPPAPAATARQPIAQPSVQARPSVGQQVLGQKVQVGSLTLDATPELINTLKTFVARGWDDARIEVELQRMMGLAG